MSEIKLQYVKLDYDVEEIQKAVNLLDTIPPLFNKFLIGKVEKLPNNNNNRHYKERAMTTEVLNICTDLIRQYKLETQRQNFPLHMKAASESIAKRLLAVERNVQNNISKLGVKVLKGSLIISFQEHTVENEADSDEYWIAIAKIKHEGYFDENAYEHRSGIPTDDGKIWKSALLKFYIDEDDKICFKEALLYSSQDAKYWADTFLELEEMHTDEVNTQNAFEQTSRILSQRLRKQSPSDYVVIYNAFLGKFKKKTEGANYIRIVDDVLSGYQPNSGSLSNDTLSSIIDELKKLPEKGKFDVEFNIIPDAVKNRVKRYNITNGISLHITDYVQDIGSVIESYTDEGTGDKYIRIKTDEEHISAYNAFLRKEQDN